MIVLCSMPCRRMDPMAAFVGGANLDALAEPSDAAEVTQVSWRGAGARMG